MRRPEKNSTAKVCANIPALRAASGRFWLRVDKSPGHGPHGDCWLWAGGNRNGYGVISICDWPIYAHRLSYFYQHGVFPSENACHKCDLGRCVNPEHLIDADQVFNVRDMWNKGRAVAPPHSYGEEHHAAHISNEDAARIRELMAGGAGQREIAAMFGVSNSTAWRIGRGVVRNHLKSTGGTA